MKLTWEDKYKNLICRSVLMSKIILVTGGARSGRVTLQKNYVLTEIIIQLI